MSEKDKQIIYTALELKRYHSGEMTEKEMHALEKAAMEDPFLADALDGYLNTNSFEADVTDIKNKLFAYKKNQKNAPLFSLIKSRWLKIAAIFILMAATAYFAWQFNNSNREQPVATIERAGQNSSSLKKMEQPVINDSLLSISPETSNSLPNTLKKEDQEEKDSRADVAVESKTLKNNSNSDDKTLNYSTEKSAALALERAEEKKESKDVADIAKSIAPSSVLRPDIKKTAKYNLTGKVIDDAGNPVPFAVISDRKSNAAAGADAEGNFSIVTNDSVAAANIAAVGYTSRDQKLRYGKDQIVVLQQSSQELSEVVVTGISRKRKKSVNAAGSVLKRDELGQATVVGGMQLFNKYIKDSLKIPESTDTEQATGLVILSFKIKKDGTPYRIRVQQSLCDACDKEAVRLLSNGPKWIYVDDKRNTVSINF